MDTITGFKSMRSLVKEAFEYARSTISSANYGRYINDHFYIDSPVDEGVRYDLFDTILKRCMNEINIKDSCAYSDKSQYINEILMHLQGRVCDSIHITKDRDMFKIDMLQHTFQLECSISNCYLVMNWYVRVILNAPPQKVAELMLAMDSFGIPDEVIESICLTSRNLAKVEEIIVATAKKLLEPVNIPLGIYLDFDLKDASANVIQVTIQKEDFSIRPAYQFDTTLSSIREDVERNLKNFQNSYQTA